MAINTVSRKVTATISHDGISGLYTFALLEKGGPIIMAKTEEEGKVKFEAALDFASAVRNLQYLDDITLIRKAENLRSKSSSKQNEVEYRHLEVA